MGAWGEAWGAPVVGRCLRTLQLGNDQQYSLSFEGQSAGKRMGYSPCVPVGRAGLGVWVQLL